jgi:hypothetical protein
MEFIYPDIDWYTKISEENKITPRCPYANVYRCPRYYSSLYLLGESGIATKIKSEKVKELDELWEKSNLLPVVAEHDTAITSSVNRHTGFSKFCPEVSYDVFRLFAVSLHRYADEIDAESAHEQLKEKAYPKDWRWLWAHVEPLHYLKCPVYSQLLSNPIPIYGNYSPKQTIQERTTTMVDANPKAFVSYSWDDNDHKNWVAQLSTRLRSDAVEVVLDQWHAVPGDQLPEFMEREIRDNDYVLIICTPKYKQKSDSRIGGVGYEGDIMTGEIYSKGNHRKFIPILARGTWEDAAPSWLKGKYFINLNGDHVLEQGYLDLLTTLRGTRPKAPPLGKKPNTAKNNYTFPQSPRAMPDDPIKILGVIADEVTEPRLDGIHGSALYSVPFRLSNAPSSLWQQLFLKAWDFPPSFTTMHRPGIASVSGDKIILDGTSIEEVAQYHRDTLVLCVNIANDEEKKIIAKQQLIEEQNRQQSAEHKSRIEDISKRIKFE